MVRGKAGAMLLEPCNSYSKSGVAALTAVAVGGPNGCKKNCRLKCGWGIRYRFPKEIVGFPGLETLLKRLTCSPPFHLASKRRG